MERILTAEQMRSADKYTIEKLGVSESELVSRAGQALSDVIISRFRGGRVLVCVGNGNNGADGKVAAENLSKVHGFNVAILNVSSGPFQLFDKKYDIILDCIFGTGLNRNVEGKYKEAIELINKSKSFVISCDIPSGVNGNNGIVMGCAVKANLTIAIQEFKTGHFLNDGPDYTGDIIVKDIGISVWEDECCKRINSADALEFFSDRPRNVNKGNFGKVSVVGGSKSFPGSVFLSTMALSAFKSGVGYSNLVVPESLYDIYALASPECTITSIKDDNGSINFDKSTIEKLLNYDAISIGMGLGVSEEVYKTVCYIIENYSGKLIIDADALNSLAKYGIDILKHKKCDVVLTPHVGEFSRLSCDSKDKILFYPLDKAIKFAREYNVTLVLKSAVSIITNGVETYLNTTGCSGMAKGGSGDVLSGFIAGVLARSNFNLEAVASACYVFGKAGELAEKENTAYSMTATDIIGKLGSAIKSLLD